MSRTQMNIHYSYVTHISICIDFIDNDVALSVFQNGMHSTYHSIISYLKTSLRKPIMKIILGDDISKTTLSVAFYNFQNTCSTTHFRRQKNCIYFFYFFLCCIMLYHVISSTIVFYLENQF